MPHVRTILLGLLCAVACVARAHAGPPAHVFRVGMITYADETAGGPVHINAVIKRELARLGYRDGDNIVYLERAGHRDFAATQRFADELVAWHADVVVSTMSNADLAMKRATAQSHTPVVFWSADPLQEQLVQSYHHPGTNFTGFSYEPNMQLLEVRFLKLLVPDMTLLCHLYNHTYAPAPSTLRDLRANAALFGLQVKVYEALDTAAFEPAIAAMHADHCGAVYIGPHELFNTHGALLGQLMLKYRLPAMGLASIGHTGGVGSYAPPFEAGWPAMAGVVDAILRGASPADIAVKRSFRSPMTINLRSIHALGLNVSDTLLDEADEVVR